MSVSESVACLICFFLLFDLPKQLDSVNPCIYESNTKGIIDLTSVGHIDGTPVWKNIAPEKFDGHMYSYNPCHSFTQSSCKDVAGCQIYATDENVAYSLGGQNSIQWAITSNEDMPKLVYISEESRSLHVDLRCLNLGEPDKLEVYGHNDTTGFYTMIFSSKCACWNGCKGKNGLGVGTIIIIVLLVLILIYLIVFMSFNKFKRQATGLNILPHRTFWFSLPGYSLDGVLFLFRKVTGRGTEYNAVP